MNKITLSIINLISTCLVNREKFPQMLIVLEQIFNEIYTWTVDGNRFLKLEYTT
jgi:hypothetical protein